MTVKIEREPEWVRLTLSGEPSVADVVAAIQRCATQSAGLRTLWIDVGDASFAPQSHELRTLAQALASAECTRVAFLVQREVHFGIGRMLATYAEFRAVDLRVFRVAREAERWLLPERQE